MFPVCWEGAESDLSLGHSMHPRFVNLPAFLSNGEMLLGW